MMPHKQGKVWGFTKEIFNKNNVSINRIFIEKGGFCSKHYHEYKNNIFFVESGSILIEEWKNEYGLVDKTILNQNDSCIVSPKTFHKFTGLEDSVVYEIYYVELFNNDIVREDTGGML